jgi:hypothetical protein
VFEDEKNNKFPFTLFICSAKQKNKTFILGMEVEQNEKATIRNKGNVRVQTSSPAPREHEPLLSKQKSAINDLLNEHE